MKSIVDNIDLAGEGQNRMHWFRANMPIITHLNAEFAKEKPFKDLTIACCFHIEPKTAYWIEGLLLGGAEQIFLVGNIGTTKADTAAYLANLDRLNVFGRESDTMEDHKAYLAQVMSQKIDLFLDNGASLILAHAEHKPPWLPLGANEETRTGKLLIEQAGIVPNYPVIVIDDSPVKKMLENNIGVGQSVVDGFMRATSLLVSGKKILILGYGNCGKGVAEKFKAFDALTMVYDIDPVLLLKARADGHITGDLTNLITAADVIITITGKFNVINEKHITNFKHGAILANAGHYSFEIDRQGLIDAADSVVNLRPGIEAITFMNKTVYLLQKAHPLNLSAADGNPIEIMDLGLGLQSACARLIVQDHAKLPAGLQTVPDNINHMISRLSLDFM
ncbi:MAG: adenosylhomocysteinase [Saccharofermentanales bacterium]|jgi:adenosylhomocysteinase